MPEKRILLVEDNPTDEALTLRSVKKCGIACQVTVMRDGAEALDHLDQISAQDPGAKTATPHLVLVDLNLPKIGGLEVLRRIRADPRFHSLTVVILTSSDEERDVRDSYRLGANSYVRKPVEFSELEQTIARLCDYWLRLNRSPGQF